MQNIAATSENDLAVLKCLKIYLSYSQARPHLDIYYIYIYLHINGCMWMFVAELFIIGKKWKSDIYKSINEQNMIYLYNKVLLINKRQKKY